MLKDEQGFLDLDGAFKPELRFSKACKTIKRLEKCSFNLLSSIVHDAAFVERAIAAFGLPVACNERCGRWYVPPHLLASSVYFKSTDGHTDHCKFSLRRLNLHILPLIQKGNGILVVDSTRRGKRMPDALSKTLPIWMCVLNRTAAKVLQLPWTEEQLKLWTAPKLVSPSEHDKISAQIDMWVDALIGSELDTTLLQSLSRPLRPLWITPESTLGNQECQSQELDYLPIVLLTASKCVPDGVQRQDGFTYIQGAADDTENSGLSELTPAIFWRDKDKILRSDSTCDQAIKEIVAASGIDGGSTLQSTDTKVNRIRNTNIYLADTVGASALEDYVIIQLSNNPSLGGQDIRYLHIPVRDGKKSLPLKAFQDVEDFVSSGFWREKIIVTDDECCRSNAAVVALFLLTIQYSLTDELRETRLGRVDKRLIQKKIVTLVNSREGLNPSRAALKSLNTYLMSESYKS